MKLDCDLHAHTHLSCCGEDSATIENYVKTAEKFGLKTIGIADHMWDKEIPFAKSMYHSSSSGDGENVVNWYRAQFIEHCMKIIDEIKNTDTKNVNFLIGGEVDYCPGIGAAITEENAQKLDFIIVPNSHTHHTMDKALYEPYEKHAEFMLKATEEICTSKTAKYITALAHPFEAVCCPYSVEFIYDKIKDSRVKEVFSMAKENNIAIEINLGSYYTKTDEEIKNCGYTRILSIAKDLGCKFTTGSDSHNNSFHDNFYKLQTVAEFLKLDESDFLNFDNMKSKLLNKN